MEYPQLFTKQYITIYQLIQRFRTRTSTNIMEQGHSWITIQKAMKYFLEHGLIIKSRQGRCVTVSFTNKGARILRGINDLEDALADIIQLPSGDVLDIAQDVMRERVRKLGGNPDIHYAKNKKVKN